jgi:hypothetical protein
MSISGIAQQEIMLNCLLFKYLPVAFLPFKSCSTSLVIEWTNQRSSRSLERIHVYIFSLPRCARVVYPLVAAYTPSGLCEVLELGTLPIFFFLKSLNRHRFTTRALLINLQVSCTEFMAINTLTKLNLRSSSPRLPFNVITKYQNNMCYP